LAREQRRLAAIVAADAVGYSRLMGRDESGTLTRLKAHRNERLLPALARNGGRMVKLTGDGALAEFGSAVDALRAAIEFQHSVAEINRSQSEDTQIVFRIGLHLGDLIVEGDDLYGDGVNVAARLEAQAPAGGIVVSSNIHDAVVNKLKVSFRDLGQLTLKNIERPVQAFEVTWDPAEGNIAESSTTVSTSAPIIAAPVERIAALAERLSIAVLPLNNLSGDKEQEYFADGISEDILTGLSRLRGFLVIARNSSFTYRGKSVDVKQIGRELGVRYILEGSVRKGGNRVRITVQLVDALNGSQVWANRYDRDLADIFAVQDEITESVVAAIEPQVYAAEGLRLQAPNPESLDAWDCVLKGLSHCWRETGDDNSQAQALFRRAIALSPTYARPYSQLAWTMVWGVLMGWVPVTDALVEEAQALAEMARVRDDQDAWSHLANGLVACYQRKTEDAERYFWRALDLNPNFSLCYSVMGVTYAYAGRNEDARKAFDRAKSMNPTDPANAVVPSWYSVVLFTEGRYEEAFQAAMETARLRPDYVGAHRVMLIAAAQMGRLDEARARLATVKRLQPAVSLAWARKYAPFTREVDREKYVESFRLAGLTE
jgi:TolB-like protein/Tfp pilus assembly protein PilF